MSMDQDDSSFEDGFNSVANPDYVPTPAADAADTDGQSEGAAAVEGQDLAAGDSATGNATGGATSADADDTDQGSGPADGDGDGADGTDTANEGNADAADEEKGFGGFTATELKNLLARAAEVDGIKDNLRKLHGRYGELNGRLQQHPAGVQLSSLSGDDFDKAVAEVMERGQISSGAYGDFDEEGITRGTVATVMRVLQQLGAVPQQAPQQAAAPAMPQAAQPDDPPSAAATHQAQVPQTYDATDSSTDLEVERRVLDRIRPKWRETVSGQDFNLWIASQDEAYQQTYRNANTADDFAGVLDQFDKWTAARQGAAARSTQTQQRLAKAITPSGHSARPQQTLTEDEAFEAGFRAVIPR